MSAFTSCKRFIISVPPNKLKFTFIKSSGPGGQNVNKSKACGIYQFFIRSHSCPLFALFCSALLANSKAKMFVDLSGEWIKPEIKEYLKVKHPSRVNSSATQLLLQSDSHRSQHQNQDTCIQKLGTILSEAEKACGPAALPSREQVGRVEVLKEKFGRERRREKMEQKDKKNSRNMKSNWRND